MKKIVALLLVFVMVFALAACGGNQAAEEPAETEGEGEEVIVDETTEEGEEAGTEDAVQVMSYEEFLAAEEGTVVTVETYVQANESWWDGKITLHAQSPEGAYYLYEVACSEEDAAKLVPGTKICVTGDKAVWNGLVEIQNCTFTFVEGDSWVAEPADFAALLSEGTLEAHMNQRIAVTDATVVDKGEGAAFFYNWDNSGEDGQSDLYFDVDINGTVCTFVVRRYLTAPGSDVYEAVKNLQVGDTVDIEGFLYWYEGPQPHITSIIVK